MPIAGVVMDREEQKTQQSLQQLRMGILGAVTAVVLCFGAAAAFAGDPADAIAQDAAQTAG